MQKTAYAISTSLEFRRVLYRSSGSGATAGPANLHAERSGAMRVFAPARHRHEAEVAQLTGLDARMTATGVEAVRGLRSEEHTSELQSRRDLVCRLLLEKKKKKY